MPYTENLDEEIEITKRVTQSMLRLRELLEEDKAYERRPVALVLRHGPVMQQETRET